MLSNVVVSLSSSAAAAYLTIAQCVNQIYKGELGKLGFCEQASPLNGRRRAENDVLTYYSWIFASSTPSYWSDWTMMMFFL